MIKRLIFDVDGTLIKNVSFEECIKNSLIEYGHFSDKIFSNFLEGIKTYELFYPFYKEDIYLDFLSRMCGVNFDKNFLKIFFEHCSKNIPKDNEEVKRVIYELCNYYELVILSNYFRSVQMNRLCAMGIGDCFIEYYGDEISKPNPIVFKEACGKNEPYECVMIGDNLSIDINPALDCKIKGIYVGHKCITNTNKLLKVDGVHSLSRKLIRDYFDKDI